MSFNAGGIGINREINTGAIFQDAYAYQLTHTESSTQGSDYLDWSVWSPSGGLVSGPALVINGYGDVGIGTTTPSSQLDISAGGATMSFSPGGIGINREINTGAIFQDAYAYQLTHTESSTQGSDYLDWSVWNPSGGLVNGPALVINGYGNVGIGTSSPGAKLEVNGGLRFSSDPSSTVQTTAWTGVLCGGDYAEAVDPAGDKNAYEAGDVLVITDDTEGDVRKSAEPYSTMVAGIFATKPGVVGRRESLPKDAQDLPMAMVGIVPTKVTAENGPIHRGDLLVTSSIPGYAMKGTDRSLMLGAVIGKAMGALDAGRGVIEVLVTLQ